MTVADIRLWSSTPSTLPHDARLRFLSIVDVPSIPLYLAAGPSFDLATDDERTAAWLSEALLAYEVRTAVEHSGFGPWWSNVGRQSDHGILVRVEDEAAQTPSDNITELLFYACAKTEPATLPTPPASSSPGPSGGSDPNSESDKIQEVKVYALPLSSKLFRHAGKASALASFPSEASFLPYGLDDIPVPQIVAQKRQSLSSLFEDATQKRRKVKGRDGEGISQAMANIDGRSQPVRPQNINKDVQEQGAPPAKAHAARKSLSRASTVASFPTSEHSRPASRGALANGKRSSLHRVASAMSPRDSPALSETDSTYAQQNKAALTKVVMAGMRLYGLQQRKKPTKDDRPLTGTSLFDPSEGEDEYKLVYHQTFKAALFAFRRQLNVQTVAPEVMREVVDQLLALFCVDPLAKDSFVDTFPGSSFQEGEPSTTFDLPSSKALVSNMGAVWNTPRTKKR